MFFILWLITVLVFLLDLFKILMGSLHLIDMIVGRNEAFIPPEYLLLWLKVVNPCLVTLFLVEGKLDCILMIIIVTSVDFYNWLWRLHFICHSECVWWLRKYLEAILLVLRTEILQEVTFTDVLHEAQVNLEDNHIDIVFREFRRLLIVGYNILDLLGYVEFFLPFDEDLIAYLFQVKVVVERVSIQPSTQVMNLFDH